MSDGNARGTLIPRPALPRPLHRDPRTGLANRLRLLDRLRHEIARSERSGLVAAVIMAGLDGLPGTSGRGARDEMLTDLELRWATCLRAGDVLADIGGDRLAVICADLPGKQQAMTVADRLRAAAAGTATAVRDRQWIPLSIGVAFASGDDVDDPAEALLRRADEARYQGSPGTLPPAARHAGAQ
jgi:diguanylate cyclase (GGDEF)-like protein